MNIKPVFISLVFLCLCLGGCGKKTAPKSRAKAKPSSASVGQEANNTQPKVESKKPEPPKVAPNSPEAVAAIDKFIRTGLDKPSGELTKEDFERVAMLVLDGRFDERISDVSALKKLTKLQMLKLPFNPLRNVSALKHLKILKILDLRSTQIRDVSVLKNLTLLTNLSLGDNQISDVTVLKELQQLKVLHLYGNQISDVSALSELKQLTDLYLTGNQISDVSALKELKKLTRLWLTDNPDLTAAQIAELQKALPKCIIEHNAKK